jgi:hypothetical protein
MSDLAVKEQLTAGQFAFLPGCSYFSNRTRRLQAGVSHKGQPGKRKFQTFLRSES